ncbi:hypothetical protein [Salipiger sp.]|uniref:hypothetical protein n=1 Tax=Salipiger sp. TaxID=2078585 RepID=UPI003A98193F
MPAFAATFTIEVYAQSIGTVSAAETYLATDPAAVARYTATTLPLIEAAGTGTPLSTVPSFATYISGNAPQTFQNTLYVIRGPHALTPAVHTYSISANDGYQLTIGA